MKRLILELSLKPFRDPTSKGTETVIHDILRQWSTMIERAETVSFLLWTADGSEILDYRGRQEDEIPWAKWIGIANEAPPHPRDPERKTLHSTGHLYCEQPPTLTYERLQSIVATLKSLTQQLTGKPVTVGTTFDPGPEFAESDFKYRRHTEINQGNTMGAKQWVHCAAVLHADQVAYAGFPHGIPESTSLGTFLGRQSQHFLSDLGFDYIWFSNGFGYSLDSWTVTGEVFDGEHFDTSKAHEVNATILQFWQDFRAECPSYSIETRGSNLSTGMDLASDASPIREIYRGGFKLTAPVNSPWAALNGDYGLEIVGWLSHLAELPEGSAIPFRYYLHDPWWLNSPWLDRYGREPHDIYLPLSSARLDADGKITPPDSVAFLTIDNSYGERPDEVPNEVTPHLLRALEDFPDAPGLITWIYPFDEYHEWLFSTPSRASEVFFGDWFMRSALNQGFPLNTVVSSANFLTSQARKGEVYKDTVLVCFAPGKGSPLAQAIQAHLQAGGRVLLYGPLKNLDADLAKLLGVRTDDTLTGEVELINHLPPDQLRSGRYSNRLFFRDILNGGGLDTVLDEEKGTGLEILAEVHQNGIRRLFAASKTLPTGGQLAWLRGALSATVSRKSSLPAPDDASVWFHSERLMRWILTRFGYHFRFEKPTLMTTDPLILAARCRGAWYFSGYSPSTRVSLEWRFPEGVPIPVGCDVELLDGFGRMSLPRAWHRECRVLVDQNEPGEISCQEKYSGEIGIIRRLSLSGLKNATVTFLPDSTYPSSQVHFQRDEIYLGLGRPIPFRESPSGHLVVEDVSGNMIISW